MDITNFSDKQLADEIERRKQEAQRIEQELRMSQADFIMKNIDTFISITPEHSRTSCSDENPVNSTGRCPRCTFLTAKQNNWWDLDIEVEITTRDRSRF